LSIFWKKLKNKEIKILLSAPRGFCAGVERAIEIVKKSLEKYGAPVYVRHEIVHNKFVVDGLRSLGAIFVEELDEIKDKSRPVIFSAHGVPKTVPIEADSYKMDYIDATCPLVSKVHREAENLYKAGYHIVLIGHNNHPEVIGTMGQLPSDAINLIQDEHDVESYELDKNKKIAYVTQTTLSVDDTKNIIIALKKKFPQIKAPFKEDICYATTNRQAAVKNIAMQCDMFFVLGSRNSSNSVRLVEVAEQSGCPHAELIHSESDIPFEKLKNCNTIGISSGASAPEILVENFINKLKDKFEIKIEEVEIIKEKIFFKVPAKLN
jgi:4-hydroxy-3-methylbut-2-enyl diphosphate reductase